VLRNEKSSFVFLINIHSAVNNARYYGFLNNIFFI